MHPGQETGKEIGDEAFAASAAEASGLLAADAGHHPVASAASVACGPQQGGKPSKDGGIGFVLG